MLTDVALKHLKPKEKIYKVTDRDGMYVLVKPTGALSFRLDYRLNGRRETVTFGKYGPAGLSLARAREMCIDAKRGDQRGTIAGDRKAAREAPAEGGEELRRVRREVADRGADGGQHARDAAVDLRARAAAGLAQPAADRDHAG